MREALRERVRERVAVRERDAARVELGVSPRSSCDVLVAVAAGVAETSGDGSAVSLAEGDAVVDATEVAVAVAAAELDVVGDGELDGEPVLLTVASGLGVGDNDNGVTEGVPLRVGLTDRVALAVALALPSSAEAMLTAALPLKNSVEGSNTAADTPPRGSTTPADGSAVAPLAQSPTNA